MVFEKFLVMEDSNLQEQFVNEIKLAKEAEAAKKTEEATKRAEEEKKAGVFKAQIIVEYKTKY